MSPPRTLKLCLALGLLLALGACARRVSAPAAVHAPLFTGHEAKRKVLLFFPSGSRPGFVKVVRQIYATTSLVAQAKQILLQLMAGPGPKDKDAVPCFAPHASFSEVYLDGQGLAVVDLPSSTVDALPGGTSCEVAILYCLVRTLCADVPHVSRVQVLVDGKIAESLRGHFDLQDPLTVSDF